MSQKDIEETFYSDDEDIHVEKTFTEEEVEDLKEEALLREEIKFSAEWNTLDRTKHLIKGSQKSLDQIIVAIHQKISLRDLKDDKFKQTSEGRLFAIETASKILQEISRLEVAMAKADSTGGKIDLEGKKVFTGGLAEQMANEKKGK